MKSTNVWGGSRHFGSCGVRQLRRFVRHVAGHRADSLALEGDMRTIAQSRHVIERADVDEEGSKSQVAPTKRMSTEEQTSTMPFP